jgi:hypothetical protein
MQNSPLSDPILQHIKSLSRIEHTTIQRNNSYEEKKKDVDIKYQNILLSDEWLDVTPAYLQLPPSLNHSSLKHILNVITYIVAIIITISNSHCICMYF